MTISEQAALGASAVRVTRLGLGTAPLGGMYSPVGEGEAAAVIRRALELGLGYFDTAPQYGHGTAERRLGAAVAELPRGSFVLSSKVGRLVLARPAADPGIFADAPPSDVVFDFSADGVRRSLEASLRRLGLSSVDLVYIHDPDADEHADQALRETYPALHQLRAEGVIGAIGVGMNQTAVPARFVRETDIDAVLLAGRYTLLDRSGEGELLPECVRRGVSVVVGGVYNSGVLADPSPGARFDYAPAPSGVVARARRLGEVCAAAGVPLKAAAIQFPFRHAAVACVLMGARSVAELEENVAMAGVPIPDSLWPQLDEVVAAPEVPR
jgi:D-threo-aldose 1-dehydrogenase